MSLLKRWQNSKRRESSLRDDYHRESSLREDYHRESSPRNNNNYKRYSEPDINGEINALIKAAQSIGSIQQQGCYHAL